MKLMTDLHMHTKEDPQDSIRHSAIELIDHAAEKGFQVLSITNHNDNLYSEYLSGYARERGILLIPGIELKIEGRDILIFNMDKSITDKIRTIDDLRKHKSKDNLIIAPHPYFPCLNALRDKFDEYADVFDAVEFGQFYYKNINFNKKAEKKARQYNLPMVGNSDAHYLWQIGMTYSIVEAEKNVESVIRAVKKHNIEIVTRPLEISTRNLLLSMRFILWPFGT